MGKIPKIEIATAVPPSARSFSSRCMLARPENSLCFPAVHRVVGETQSAAFSTSRKKNCVCYKPCRSRQQLSVLLERVVRLVYVGQGALGHPRAVLPLRMSRRMVATLVPY